MKISKINNIVGILGGIGITKLPDKQVKTTILNDYLYLRKFIRDAEDESAEVSKKFREDWGEEMEAVETMIVKNEPVVGHENYIEAKKDAEKILRDIMDRDVDIEIKSVQMDDFMNACKNENLTLEQIAFLQEVGILE